MRKLLFVMTVCALAVSGLATRATASDASITAGLSRSTVLVGTTVYVQGKVTPAGATPKVVVQRVVDHKWVDRVTGNVNPSTGAYKIAITPSQHGTYKLRVRSAGGSVLSSIIYLSVTQPSISISLSSTSVTVGTTVYVQGRVAPKTATSRVVVQRAIDHRWEDRATGVVNASSGAYKIAIAPSQAGTYRLRVRSNGGSVRSREVLLTVKAKPKPPSGGGGGSCNPNYTPCVPNASDVDCAGGSGNGPAYVQGPVKVIGTDVYGLDSDHDGIGCE